MNIEQARGERHEERHMKLDVKLGDNTFKAEGDSLNLGIVAVFREWVAAQLPRSLRPQLDALGERLETGTADLSAAQDEAKQTQP